MTGPILALAGPTASGKTALSLQAAKRLNGEIINADSMQIYQGLPVLSAQPTDEERAAAPHHLFGVLDPAERCSVGRWARLALEVIEDVEARGKVPILVGGTGLYFKALTDGLAPAPEIPEAVFAEVQALVDEHGLAGLRREAMRVDPVAADRIEAADRQRLMRVVSVYRAAGKPLSELQAATEPLIAPERLIGLVIAPEREALYARIEARFDTMMDAGALDEARDFAARGLNEDLPAMKAVGLPPLLEHVSGEIDLASAATRAKRDSRRYAKRQFTWFSNQHGSWPRISALDPKAQRDELEALLDRHLPLK